MKRPTFAVSVAVLALAVAVQAQAPAQTQTESVEQELIKLENDMDDAMIKHNWAFIDRILAEDYTLTGPDGILLTKAELMAGLKSGEDVVTSSETDEMKARVYGDAAVVTYRWISKGTFKGKDVSRRSRWTDTWVKDYAGRWRCVASHGSRIYQK